MDMSTLNAAPRSLIKAIRLIIDVVSYVVMTKVLRPIITMFNKCKMGLQKAFEDSFLMAVNKKAISSCALKDLVKVNQKSAWLLGLKAQQTNASSESKPLEGIVHVDESNLVLVDIKRELRADHWMVKNMQ